jgi:inner membrane protein
MAAARIHHRQRLHQVSWSTLAMWSAASLLPDLDFIGLAFGVPLDATWGHRGATHSFAFAISVGLATALVVRRRGQPAARIGIGVALVVASHPILDAMTNHGPGCALFWPFDATKYLAPWTPVPTLPNFESLTTIVAWQIAAQEFILFTPLWLFALWPFLRRRPVALGYNPPD